VLTYSAQGAQVCNNLFLFSAKVLKLRGLSWGSKSPPAEPPADGSLLFAARSRSRRPRALTLAEAAGDDRGDRFLQ
jgi:hypothetical protein